MPTIYIVPLTDSSLTHVWIWNDLWIGLCHYVHYLHKLVLIFIAYGFYTGDELICLYYLFDLFRGLAHLWSPFSHATLRRLNVD